MQATKAGDRETALQTADIKGQVIGVFVRLTLASFPRSNQPGTRVYPGEDECRTMHHPPALPYFAGSMPPSVFSVDVEEWFHILDVPSTPPLEQWAALPSRMPTIFPRNM